MRLQVLKRIAVCLLALSPVIGAANTLNEGVVYTLSTPTAAGDVVICEFTVTHCTTSTPTSEWSDVVVFYDSLKGPFQPDASVDANRVYVFSDDSTSGRFGGLAEFLAKYKGLSSDATAVSENALGQATVRGYLINSRETVPEPGSNWILSACLLGVPFLRKKLLNG